LDPVSLGHASVLTTECYLGCKQNLEQSVNDRFGPLIAFKEWKRAKACSRQLKPNFPVARDPGAMYEITQPTCHYWSFN
jgi:hypothetical protein